MVNSIGAALLALHQCLRRGPLVLCCALALTTQTAVAAVDVVCGQVFEVLEGADSLEARYCGNIDLNFDDTAVNRAVIVVHGSSRNADDYLSYVEQAGFFADGAVTLSAIIAPQFLTDEDVAAFNLSADTLYWSSSGWKKGNTSNSSPYPRPFNVSSFEVVDRIIRHLADDAAYPNLVDIVVVGHSAGGQFVQRYAAGGQAENVIRPGLSFRYVFANPSSYLYFSAERARNGTLDSFEVPKTKGCKVYDDYKYGLKQLNAYMNAVGADGLREQYPLRDTTVLLGEFDDDPDDPSMDDSCSAKKQGAHRLERGRIYFNHVLNFFGGQAGAVQSIAFVPSVGHSGREMLQSDCALSLLFDYDSSGTACAYEIGGDGGGGDGGGGDGGSGGGGNGNGKGRGKPK